MKVTLTSNSPEETKEFGRRVAMALGGRGILFLDGEMGSGKTVMAKGLYLGSGGQDEEQVLSPSYTLVNRYDDADVTIYHVDLYRLKRPQDIHGIEYEEFLYENPGLTILEWPKSAEQLLDSDDFMWIRFEPGTNDGQRVIHFESEGDQFTPVFEELHDAC